MLGMENQFTFSIRASVEEMVNMAAIALLMRRRKERKSKFNLVLNVVNYKCVKSNKWT
jgi:hypothetical protein